MIWSKVIRNQNKLNDLFVKSNLVYDDCIHKATAPEENRNCAMEDILIQYKDNDD